MKRSSISSIQPMFFIKKPSTGRLLARKLKPIMFSQNWEIGLDMQMKYIVYGNKWCKFVRHDITLNTI